MKHPVPTVAAVHDLSGVGRCALTVAIPVISAMGLQVCPAPTACLSAHTGFAGSHRLETVDLSDYLARQLSAWNQMGLKFDCVYTGYLGSPRQAAAVSYTHLDVYKRQGETQPMADITAMILTKNEEKNLPDCLKSIRGFCARAVVVDCGKMCIRDRVGLDPPHLHNVAGGVIVGIVGQKHQDVKGRLGQVQLLA